MTYSLNTLKNDPRASSADADSKPTGFRRFAQEIALTAGFVFMTFWLLALLTHSPLDPAWTTSGAGNAVRNFGGRLGALFGDLSFFFAGLFGVVVLCRRLGDVAGRIGQPFA